MAYSAVGINRLVGIASIYGIRVVLPRGLVGGQGSRNRLCFGKTGPAKPRTALDTVKFDTLRSHTPRGHTAQRMAVLRRISIASGQRSYPGFFPIHSSSHSNAALVAARRRWLLPFHANGLTWARSPPSSRPTRLAPPRASTPYPRRAGLRTTIEGVCPRSATVDTTTTTRRAFVPQGGRQRSTTRPSTAGFPPWRRASL